MKEVSVIKWRRDTNHNNPKCGAHAKKHPACLQSALGFLDFDGFAVERVTSPRQKSRDALGSQGWVSCG
eukprot:1982002-Pyramimonas_sp.AAC.1